ncbi:lipid phosphate phosphatase gamma isoform X2 [Phoenix dactylifera]|uniref:Lipid phosphate phosphatase gamma isoform X2 n=1 Tax=Phoenix dactylifera TaxID=42345 RepID=A0A8B7C7R9_PHODC|nr:lipid phosphate phosphatase gamma isoform X2 [Phoenix dactylifera]
MTHRIALVQRYHSPFGINQRRDHILGESLASPLYLPSQTPIQRPPRRNLPSTTSLSHARFHVSLTNAPTIFYSYPNSKSSIPPLPAASPFPEKPPGRREDRVEVASTANGMASPSPAAALKAVTLTHVRYRRGDSLGHFLAWVSLIPVFISLGGFVTHFVFRRELQGLCFALGLIVSQVLNELIKTSVQQSRPATCAALEMCESHGWPSSHAQYMFFFAAYFTLLCYKGVVGVASSRSRLFLAFLPWPPAVLTMYSRVYLGYHTVAQVFAGATLGVVLGVGWFWIVNSMLMEYFPAIEESPVGRFLYIKDTSHIPNVLKFEYDNARAARKKLAQD